MIKHNLSFTSFTGGSRLTRRPLRSLSPLGAALLVALTSAQPLAAQERGAPAPAAARSGGEPPARNSGGEREAPAAGDAGHAGRSGGNFEGQRSGNLRSGGADDVRGLLKNFDLAGDVFAWRGAGFSLGDATMAQARFERYLSTAPGLSEEDIAYTQLLETINQRLVGRGGGNEAQRVAEAWRMLYQAAEFPMDNGLSETLADRIISFWQQDSRIRRLWVENERLERERSRTESELATIGARERREFIDMMRQRRDGLPPPDMHYDIEPREKRLQETESRLSENRQMEEASRLNQKLEFQSLILQFFVQRRFQHALIANTFYRYIFSEEESSLDGTESMRKQIFGDIDVKLTTSTIDAIAKEAIADVDETMRSVVFLFDRGEIHSGTRRLMEAYYLGEYLPAVKTLPMSYKRTALEYLRSMERLANALEVKNFDRSDELIEALNSTIQDVDLTPAEAFVATSRQMSSLAVKRAMTAAAVQDREGMEIALAEAVRYWPTNPQIQEFTVTVLEKTNLQDLAAADFDRFVRQNDLRAVFNDRFRFAAALAMDGERNPEFLGIMERMEKIEGAMAQARELVRIGNDFAAWEVLERVYQELPDDQELNRMRGDYAVRASRFAAILAEAGRARENGDTTKALHAFLRARDLHPSSYFAAEGVRELTADLLVARRTDAARGRTTNDETPPDPE